MRFPTTLAALTALTLFASPAPADNASDLETDNHEPLPFVPNDAIEGDGQPQAPNGDEQLTMPEGRSLDEQEPQQDLFDADPNGDGTSDVQDLIYIVLNWGSCPGMGEACPGDTNGDGFVDVQDLTQVIFAIAWD